jgi:nucleotide-binding universal stress UspA family protein
MTALLQPSPRPTSAFRPGGKVLLATDLSSVSEPATEEALALAVQLNAPLVAVSVIDSASIDGTANPFAIRVDQLRADREAVAQRLVRRGRQAGVPVTFLVWEGQPGPSILDAASAEGATVIVVGRHRRPAGDATRLGSVSEHVVRHSSRPVVVVEARSK